MRDAVTLQPFNCCHAQAIPRQNDYLVHVHPDHHSRIAPQIRSVRHLPHATYPPPRQRSRWRHHLRLDPERGPGPAFRLGGILRRMRSHGW
jgi:hypothetical protein